MRNRLLWFSLHAILEKALAKHQRNLRACRACAGMASAPIAGAPVSSRILLVGQAPGAREPELGRPFAWTAGRVLFGWFEGALSWDESETRERVYFAAVCRCFPGKRPGGGDRVPSRGEIAHCGRWLRAEFELLRPELVIAVGRLAISQFTAYANLEAVVGRMIAGRYGTHRFDLVCLPHPSGASPWPRKEPGKSLTRRAMALIAAHPAVAWGGQA